MFCNTPGTGAAEERAAVKNYAGLEDKAEDEFRSELNSESDVEPNKKDLQCNETCCYTDWKPLRHN